MKLAIIPARGGSKRILRKNIRPFAGKPIIAYSIEAAVRSELFDHIIVSTDDEEIAEVALSFGAEVPFVRPDELSDDYCSTVAIISHAIQWANDNLANVDYACCIYATAPFVQPKYLREGYEKLIDSKKSYAFSVTSFSSPVQRAIRIRSDGCVEMLYPEFYNFRSQDLEAVFHDAGQFYWGKASAFLNDEMIYLPSSVPVLLPRHLVEDIDTLDDWHRAEYMYQALCLGGEIT